MSGLTTRLQNLIEQTINYYNTRAEAIDPNLPIQEQQQLLEAAVRPYGNAREAYEEITDNDRHWTTAEVRALEAEAADIEQHIRPPEPPNQRDEL